MSKVAAVFLTFVFLVAPPLSHSAESKARTYKIGLQLYTVRDECAKDLPGTLRAVAKMGFSGVEFAGYYGRSAQELRQMLDENHLACYGSHVSLDDLAGDNFDKTVAFNKALGNHLLVVPWIPDQQRNTKEALLKTAGLFSEIAAKLHKQSIDFAYHNHSWEFQKMDGETIWDTFFANTDRRVKIEFDTGNALEGGAQAANYLTKYPGRLIAVHVKDFSASNRNALLGEGDENWREVVPILKSRSGPRFLIIEQEQYPFPSLECAEKCLQSFRKMLSDSRT